MWSNIIVAIFLAKSNRRIESNRRKNERKNQPPPVNTCQFHGPLFGQLNIRLIGLRCWQQNHPIVIIVMAFIICSRRSSLVVVVVVQWLAMKKFRLVFFFPPLGIDRILVRERERDRPILRSKLLFIAFFFSFCWFCSPPLPHYRDRWWWRRFLHLNTWNRNEYWNFAIWIWKKKTF